MGSPEYVFEGFVTHGYLGGKRLLNEVLYGTAEGEALAGFVVKVEPEECLTLHSVCVVALYGGVYLGACVDDALVDDGHYAAGVVYGIVAVFGEGHASCCDGD